MPGNIITVNGKEYYCPDSRMEQLLSLLETMEEVKPKEVADGT